ncbi:hypothetical protein J2T28_002247 [Kerstersia gyiorum]|nr:hypothetical protein [Kerstersia gyiorum]MCP1637145.1 hypothetical protein [Kerstersia gyiorum]
MEAADDDGRMAPLPEPQGRGTLPCSYRLAQHIVERQVHGRRHRAGLNQLPLVVTPAALHAQCTAHGDGDRFRTEANQGCIRPQPTAYGCSHVFRRSTDRQSVEGLPYIGQRLRRLKEKIPGDTDIAQAACFHFQIDHYQLAAVNLVLTMHGKTSIATRQHPAAMPDGSRVQNRPGHDGQADHSSGSVRALAQQFDHSLCIFRAAHGHMHSRSLVGRCHLRNGDDLVIDRQHQVIACRLATDGFQLLRTLFIEIETQENLALLALQGNDLLQVSLGKDGLRQGIHAGLGIELDLHKVIRRLRLRKEETNGGRGIRSSLLLRLLCLLCLFLALLLCLLRGLGFAFRLARNRVLASRQAHGTSQHQPRKQRSRGKFHVLLAPIKRIENRL